MKAKTQKKMFVELTPAQAATVNGGGKYWNHGVVKGSTSTDSPT